MHPYNHHPDQKSEHYQCLKQPCAPSLCCGLNVVSPPPLIHMLKP